MKVDVIKCLSHSIELFHGETSVCITPGEAENLIAQLRAVVPAPSDVEDAADHYAREWHDNKREMFPEPAKRGFIAGAEWQRNKPIPEDVQEAANKAAYQYAKTNRRICSNEVCERLVFCGNLADAFKAGIGWERARKMQRVGEEWGDKLKEE